MGTEQIVVDTEQIVVDKVRLRFEAGTWVVDPSGKAQGFLALDKVSVLMDMARCHCMASAFVEASASAFAVATENSYRKDSPPLADSSSTNNRLRCWCNIRC